jgi:hypothetical protein
LSRRTLDIRKTFDIRKTLDLRKTPDIRKTFDLRKVLNIRKILLLVDGRNGTHGASKVREDKADGPALDAEEVTVLLSTNAKG